MRAAATANRAWNAAGHRVSAAALSVGGRGNPRSSGYERAADDWYCEPPWLVDALLDCEQFVGSVHDPACGGGTIPARCLARGIPATGADIIARGFGEVEDFFLSSRRADNIIVNPPFDRAQEFAERALLLATRKVAIVQRLVFLESQKRRPWFQRTPLAHVWVSSRRACMPPGDGWTDGQRAQWGALKHQKGRGGAIAYGWFVWDHAHSGPPTLGWLP